MSWHLACAIADIGEGQMKTVSLAGVEVLLIGREGGVSALPPMCPHLEEPLENGLCDGKVLTCMQHMWQWELDSGKPIGLAEAPLAMYETKVEDGQVFVFVTHELHYDRG